ncbi:MAG: cupin domain-containing protein [Nitrososphaerales archaeon]
MKSRIDWINVESLEWRKIGSGVYVKILNEDSENNTYTRLLKFEPGAKTAEASIHEFWEEVFVVNGSLIDESSGAEIKEGYYACRPPGTKHGPFKSVTGCLVIEFTFR